VSFQEHESGPELLVYVAAATAGVTLAKSVIDLIVAVIKARSEGIKHGDHPSDPLELIVRRTCDGGEFREEIVLRVPHKDAVRVKEIRELLIHALSNLLDGPKR